MENMPQSQSHSKAQENLQITALEQEQENLENNQEEAEKTPEELTHDQERINQRIQEIEEEKKRRIENVAVFVEKAKEIVAEGGGVSVQFAKMQESGIIDLLPQNILGVIEENKKYNFIDYAAAELLLKEDDLDNELESLQNQLDINQKNIENQELPMQDSLERLDEISEKLDEEKKQNQTLEENIKEQEQEQEQIESPALSTSM